MIINKEGSAGFWVDPSKNPQAFKDGNSVSWINFELEGEKCEIVSEGKTLSAIFNPKTEREFMICQALIDFNPTQRHMFSITWSPTKIILYQNAQVLQELNPSDFDLP